MEIIKVLIADDQRLMREGLATLLALADDIDIVAQAGDGAEAIELAKTHRPDVILMDIQMPHVNGVEATKTIRSILPRTQIIILTTFDDDEYLLSGLRAGACGYLLKDMPSEQLADAIRSAAKGQSPIGPEMARKLVDLVTRNPIAPAPPTASELSEREIEVLRLVAGGLSNKEIARSLTLSPYTVKAHLNNIFRKFNVTNRSKLMAVAMHHPRGVSV